MTNSGRKLIWILFVVLAVSIGSYPLVYLFFDMSDGLLASKATEVKESFTWSIAFYVHISFGGISLLSGFSQFSEKLRINKIKIHKLLGKIYMLSVFLSGTSGIFIAINATGGTISEMGFGLLAVLWLFTTVIALKSIKEKKIKAHQEWMIRSYALTFAAVTLRLWLPVVPAVLNLDFVSAYVIISWLCWVPNIIIAELIIQLPKRVQAR
jgi:uncharacterized membrane protein